VSYEGESAFERAGPVMAISPGGRAWQSSGIGTKMDILLYEIMYLACAHTVNLRGPSHCRPGFPLEAAYDAVFSATYVLLQPNSVSCATLGRL